MTPLPNLPQCSSLPKCSIEEEKEEDYDDDSAYWKAEDQKEP